METVLRVLRANTAARSHTQKEQLRQLPLPTSSPGVSSGDSVARSHVQWLRHRATQSGQQRWRHALHRRLLNRRLLLAVTPWVGDVVLPCTQVPQRPAAVQTQADGLREQLQQARLASTPVFTLFTQLFQIDTAGCLEVVRERKALPPRLPQAGARDPPVHLLQATSSQMCQLKKPQRVPATKGAEDWRPARWRAPYPRRPHWLRLAPGPSPRLCQSCFRRSGFRRSGFRRPVPGRPPGARWCSRPTCWSPRL